MLKIVIEDVSEWSRKVTMLIIRGYNDWVRSFKKVRNLFNNEFGNSPPILKSTFARMIYHVQETHFVKDHPRTGRPKPVTWNDQSI